MMALHPQFNTSPVGPIAASSDPAIETHALVVAYGNRRAVDGLDFSVPRGSIYGLLGANGAGKTTLVKTLLGLRRPVSGSARVLGYDVASQQVEICARAGYVSEHNSLYTSLSVAQLAAFCRSTSRTWHQETFERYLGLFHVPAGVRVGKLSKGMRTQLSLCLAMGSDPDLLILDEPTAGLDPVARHIFLKTLVGEVAAEGKTIFFSSHNLADIETVADWVGILARGRLRLSSELDRLKETHKLVRVTYTSVPAEEELAALAALPGVGRLELEGRSVRLRLAGGDAALLASSLRERPLAVLDVDVVDLNLERIALEYLGDGLEAMEAAL
jgi:ABC-2 type transport system ATP-binding protein